MANFADKLLKAIDEKKNPSIVGLDPDFDKLPDSVKRGSRGDSLLGFNKTIIESIEDVVPAVKLQSAFYEVHGADGVKAFWDTAKYAKEKGLLVVGDVKRNDIGNTSRAYSKAYLGVTSPLDCITVNPYLGSDGILPFLDDARENGKGIFVLVKTSNPSSDEIQNLITDDKAVYEKVGELVRIWGTEHAGRRGYSSVGAVVGATYPEEAKVLRETMPKTPFLVPGYGAQGGGASGVVPCFNSDGLGALVASSRGIIFASSGKDFGEAARKAALRMKEDLTKTLKEAGICPW